MTHSAYLVSSLVPFLSFLHELTSRNSLLTLLTGDGHWTVSILEVAQISQAGFGDQLTGVCGPVST